MSIKHSKDFICTQRVKLPKNKGYGYCIASLSDLDNKKYMTGDELKKSIRRGNISVTNLLLTSDNRLVFRKFTKPQENRYSRIRQLDSYDILKVSDLIRGHILNQNIYAIKRKQFKGAVPSTSKTCTSELLIGVGCICTNDKLKLIKQCYGDDCTVKVMGPYDIREYIIRSKEFRHRLAVFYSEQMLKAEYMHLDRIKSVKAKKIYEVMKKTLLTSEYLEKDPNLLMILFVLYGHHMYTFEHSVDVAIYSCMIYAILHNNTSKDDLHDLFLCGLLHDIGKISVSVDILDKGGILSDKELENIQQHPDLSARIIHQLCNCESKIFNIFNKDKSRRKRLIDGALYHHKNNHASPDGKAGYPTDIGVQSNVENNAWFLRIISVADCLDGMLSPRPYRARRGVKPNKDMGQRDYIGAATAIKFLINDVKANKLGVDEVGAVVKLLYGDDAHDFDDEYGKKIKNITFNLDIIYNYKDITKFKEYQE